jgi:hypothetical protein
MRLLKTIAIVVDWAIAVAFSISGLVYVLAHFFRESLADVLPGTPFLLHGWGLAAMALAALAVLAINAAVAYCAIRAALGADYLKLHSDDGRVNVSVRALREALEGALMAVHEISEAHVVVAAPGKPGKPVIIRAHVSLSEGVVYHSISRGIISILESKFGDVVSPGTPVECHVYWDKIRNDNPRLTARRQMLAEGLRPQFPVGDEGQDVP